MSYGRNVVSVNEALPGLKYIILYASIQFHSVRCVWSAGADSAQQLVEGKFKISKSVDGLNQLHLLRFISIQHFDVHLWKCSRCKGQV